MGDHGSPIPDPGVHHHLGVGLGVVVNGESGRECVILQLHAAPSFIFRSLRVHRGRRRGRRGAALMRAQRSLHVTQAPRSAIPRRPPPLSIPLPCVPLPRCRLAVPHRAHAGALAYSRCGPRSRSVRQRRRSGASVPHRPLIRGRGAATPSRTGRTCGSPPLDPSPLRTLAVPHRAHAGALAYSRCGPPAASVRQRRRSRASAAQAADPTVALGALIVDRLATNSSARCHNSKLC